MASTTLPLDKRINYRLNQISHRWSALVIAMARTKYSLNPVGIKVLSVIACYQPLSPSDLVERTSSDSPKIARAIGYLSEQGLIERVPDPADGRRALLRITPKGASVNEDINSLSNIVERKITGALSDAQLEALYSILDTLEIAVHQQLRGSSWAALADEAEVVKGAKRTRRGRA